MANYEKFWQGLSTKTRNALERYEIVRPWEATIKELIRTPGIGPGAIREIASATEKHCV